MTAGPRRMVSTGRAVGHALRRLRDYIYSSVVIIDTKFLSEVYKSEIYLVWVSRGGSDLRSQKLPIDSILILESPSHPEAAFFQAQTYPWQRRASRCQIWDDFTIVEV